MRAALQDVVRLGPVRSMSRARPDHIILRWRLSDPTALPAGGVFPFVIDWGTTPHPSAALPTEGGLLRLVATHPDAVSLRPILDVFRPLIDEPHGGSMTPGETSITAGVSLAVDISIVEGPEPGLRARLQTPNGEIDLV